jgi:hypothetical protein
MLRRVPDSVEAMTMGKVLVAWRDEEENGMTVGVFDVPADLAAGGNLDREVQALMVEWDTVAVVDREGLPDMAA